jgi:hypothetical protein
MSNEGVFGNVLYPAEFESYKQKIGTHRPTADWSFPQRRTHRVFPEDMSLPLELQDYDHFKVGFVDVVLAAERDFKYSVTALGVFGVYDKGGHNFVCAVMCPGMKGDHQALVDNAHRMSDPTVLERVLNIAEEDAFIDIARSAGVAREDQ